MSSDFWNDWCEKRGISQEPPSPDEVWPQVVGYVANKGYTGDDLDRRACGLYRRLTGEFPKTVASLTKPMQCSAHVQGRIVSDMIRWMKNKGQA